VEGTQVDIEVEDTVEGTQVDIEVEDTVEDMAEDTQVDMVADTQVEIEVEDMDMHGDVEEVEDTVDYIRKDMEEVDTLVVDTQTYTEAVTQADIEDIKTEDIT